MKQLGKNPMPSGRRRENRRLVVTAKDRVDREKIEVKKKTAAKKLKVNDAGNIAHRS